MSPFDPEELPARDREQISDLKRQQEEEAVIPDPIAPVWPWALGSAVLGAIGLYIGLELGVGGEIPEPGTAPEAGNTNAFLPGILWPVLVAVIGVSFWVYRASVPEFVRLIRGAMLVCVLTGLFAGITSVFWLKGMHPEILDARIDEMARQMQLDGYSVGDIELYAENIRNFWGVRAVFIGALGWTIAALIPSVLVVMVGRK